MNGVYFRSERLRQKYLRLTDGEPRLVYLLFEINRCDFDEEIVDFLIFRGLTGKKLFEFVEEKFGRSPAKLIAWCSKSIERRNVARPRVLDLNWR